MTVPPPQSKSIAPVLLALVIVLLACIGGGAILYAFSGNASESQAVGRIPDVGVRPSPSNPPPRSNAKTSMSPRISEGTWLVGEEVPAGKYRTPGALEGIAQLCYAHTSKTDSDADIIEQVVANGTTEPARITLKAGQYFKTSGCQPWVKQ
jgi:hypothetical protein